MGLTQSPLKLMERPSVTPMDQVTNLPSTLTQSRNVEQDDDAVLQPRESLSDFFSACSPVISLSVMLTTAARTAVGYLALEANARIINVDFHTKVQK